MTRPITRLGNDLAGAGKNEALRALWGNEMSDFWPEVYPDDFVGPLPEGAMRESDYTLLCIVVAGMLICSVLAAAVEIAIIVG